MSGLTQGHLPNYPQVTWTAPPKTDTPADLIWCPVIGCDINKCRMLDTCSRPCRAKNNTLITGTNLPGGDTK